MSEIINKIAEAKGTYWDQKGKYQKEFDAYFKKLVPASGKARSDEGEWLRVFSNIVYEVFNNGAGCNEGRYEDFIYVIKNSPLIKNSAVKKVYEWVKKTLRWMQDNEREQRDMDDDDIRASADSFYKEADRRMNDFEKIIGKAVDALIEKLMELGV